MSWWNDYVGIPYESRGRTREGADCWGLVRLVLREQYGHELPSFDGYVNSRDPHVDELIAREREGWITNDTAQTGDVVLFRIAGRIAHIGIVAAPGTFLHAREGHAATIERLDSPRWKSRVAGFYSYSPGVTLAACPHPLKTYRIDGFMPAGMTLAQIATEMRVRGGFGGEHEAAIMLDGRVIDAAHWADITPRHGQRVEYRALLRSSGVGRTIAMIAIVVLAAWIAPYLAVPLIQGMSVTAATLVTNAVAAGLVMAGSMLVNSIFPVRPPNDPGQAEKQNLLSGAANQANPFGAIPVVLGRFRYTPPLGATAYSETNATTAYLRVLLVWGYGPLQITDLRIGDTKLDTLEDIEHETLTGWDDTAEDRNRFNRLYGQDVAQEYIGIELVSDGTDLGSPWTEREISSECDRITVTLHFPEGLRQMPSEGSNAGNIDPCPFIGQVQVRQVGSPTWREINEVFEAQVINLTPAWFNVDTDEALESVYRWTRLSLDAHSNLIVRHGAYTTDPNAAPTGNLLTRQQNTTFGFDTSYDLLPALGSSEEALWDICVFGDTIYSTVDRRDASITGCALTTSGFKATVAAGSIARAQTETILYGAAGQPWYKRKDAFSTNISFSVPNGTHEVRVRRRNSSESEFSYPSGNEGRKMHSCSLIAITGYKASRPVVRPPGVQLAMTAIRVKATDQINGNIEGISGTVQVICKDWDAGTSTWIVRPTRNPASLLRHVLQHPGNAQACADAEIDLAALQAWHVYCKANKFMFDAVLTQQRSLLDTLRDIAAAGRASPTMTDGLWTVVIDRERTTVAQHFTPHNSWGFEGVRAMIQQPHAFRVTFNNAAKSYQPDEMIVYNTGYTSSNATLFEGLALPGVTTTDQIFKHARFHFAQLTLRPETYTLNADIEHLICTRGDLVRCTHDVPMWGLGSGRIKNFLSTTSIELDEAMTMAAATQYTIRIRLADGSSITRTVAAKVSGGSYTTIDLTTTITSTEGAPGNLFMFGALSSESVELIVHSIEPSSNMTARITLVDYAPAVYDSDLEAVPAFDSQITLPPPRVVEKITQRPTIGTITSDETVMSVAAPGQYQYRIKVAFTNPQGLRSNITHIEGQIDYAEDASLNWAASKLYALATGAVVFDDVAEGELYRVRLRYVGANGTTGPWTAATTHTVTGKTNPPSTVTGFTVAEEGARLRLDWTDSPEVDLSAYEVRTSDSGWGDASRVFRGKASTCLVSPPAAGVTKTWYVKARDVTGLYSTAAASVSYTTAGVPNPTTLNYSFADTSLTAATITLDWDEVTPPLGLKSYRVSFGSTTKTVYASTLTLSAGWIGDRTFTIKAVDQQGNMSSGYSRTITKLAPGVPTGVQAQVIDNTVMLYWTLPAITSLPISHTLIKRGTTWAGATTIGKKAGEFTTISETTGGDKTYWLAVVDTDGYTSTPVSVKTNVGEPPDFVLHGNQTSTFTGTLTNALLEDGTVVLPIDTTETWAQHFTNNAWSTPQDQIDAGYPVYLQPTPLSGSYTETFDFGTVLSSCNVSVAWTGEEIGAMPTVACTIELSDDDVTYTAYAGVESVFSSGLQYVRVTLDVDGTDVQAYRITSLTCRADAKQVSDAGTVACVDTDTNGTVANFSKEFLDVVALTVTPASTTPVTAVYDFNDAVITGTYSITSNVATVNATAHGLETGQAVKLNFTSGGVTSQVATITKVNANQYTAPITHADVTGPENVSTYPQGMRVYLFDNTGARVSGTASWAAKGY